MTREEFEAQAREQGFAAPVLVERDAGYRLDDHAHPFEAFALILDGELTIAAGGIAAPYPAGTSFRLAPGTPHREWAGAQGVRYLSARKEHAA